MLKKLKNKRGEGYVDMCVGVIVFVMILVIAIKLLETATYTGCFGSEFWERDSELLDQYYYYGIDYDADEYFNTSYHRVQLGHTMRVTVSVGTYVNGLGVFKIPVTLRVTRSGLSQKYWK